MLRKDRYSQKLLLIEKNKYLHNHCVKVSVFGVILVFIQPECGKIGARTTPNTDTFNAMNQLRKSF